MKNQAARSTVSLPMLLLALATLGLSSGQWGCPSTAEPVKPDDKTKVTRPQPKGESAIAKEYRNLALKNVCPKGFEKLQGDWKFIGKSKAMGFKEQLNISGTRYINRMSETTADGPKKAQVTGEIRCLFKNRVLFMIDKVEPPGAFGNKAGDIYPCDVLDAMGKDKGDRIMLICFFTWDLSPVKGKEYEYGRIQPSTP